MQEFSSSSRCWIFWLNLFTLAVQARYGPPYALIQGTLGAYGTGTQGTFSSVIPVLKLKPERDGEYCKKEEKYAHTLPSGIDFHRPIQARDYPIDISLEIILRSRFWHESSKFIHQVWLWWRPSRTQALIDWGNMPNKIYLQGLDLKGDPWRNGSASDSRSEGCVFDSRRVQFYHPLYLVPFSNFN